MFFTYAEILVKAQYKRKNATGYHIGAKYCHDAAGWLESAEVGVFFVQSATGKTVTEYGIKPIPTTCRHKLPVIVKPLSDAGIGFTLQANRITNNKNSIYNE